MPHTRVLNIDNEYDGLNYRKDILIVCRPVPRKVKALPGFVSIEQHVIRGIDLDIGQTRVSPSCCE